MSARASRAQRGASSLWATKADVAKTLSRLTGASPHRTRNLKISPTRVLALRLQGNTLEHRQRYGFMYNATAKMTSERLPVLTLQRLLQQQDLRDEKELSNTVTQTDDSVWKDRINVLASKGWTEEDLDHWVWILSADQPDTRVTRLVTSERPKPLFLLLVMLHSGQKLKSKDSYRKLFEYITKNYLSPRDPSDNVTERNDPSKGIERMTMPAKAFSLVLRRLAYRLLQSWPASIVTLAQLTQEYIISLPSSDSGDANYRERCTIFNQALVLFSRPAATQPLKNMDYNWRAQKLLLSMSDQMDHPLIIDMRSYRAIRQVMVAQKKTQAERHVAQRYAKTWPPYRRDFDGHDAKRTPQDDYSRSVKVGHLATEAGYEESEYDKALGILGGLDGQSPTIQTRSLPPKKWENEKEHENFYTVWAMKVRSTRNAQEAWRAFNSFTDEAPTLQVYLEMFLKLDARAVDTAADVLPGDSRESFPVHHGNYSEYELARQTPPTIPELYQRMRSHGVKPAGLCLQHLISTARSVEEGLQYLRDGGYPPVAITSLQERKSPHLLARFPLMTFTSYITLLCRKQSNRHGQRRMGSEELHHIQHAFELAKLRLPPDTPQSATFRPVWQVICRALARHRIALVNGDDLANSVKALEMFLEVNRSVEATIGLDPEIFLYYCRTVEKVMKSHLKVHDPMLYDYDPRVHSPAVMMQGTSHLGDLLRDARQSLGKSFAKMSTPSARLQSNVKLPPFFHVIAPVHQHAYMRSLAFLEDVAGMVNLLEWMLNNFTFVDQEAEKMGRRGRLMIAKTLCAFQGFARPQLDRATCERLDAEMSRVSEAASDWGWPSQSDIEAYIQSDDMGDSTRLRSRIIAAQQHQNSEIDQQSLGAQIQVLQ